MESNKLLWKIMVPFHDNDGKKFPIEHHRKWDAFVRSIAGGLSIFKTAKGQWINDDVLYFDRVIPVEIMCTEKQIETIMHYTLTFYNQTAVMCYLVSEKAKILYAN